MTQPDCSSTNGSTGDSPEKVTYWLKHNGHFVASVKAPTGLPAQTVRFLALHQFDRMPVTDLPMELPDERRRKIANADVLLYTDSSSDLFAERVQRVA